VGLGKKMEIVTKSDRLQKKKGLKGEKSFKSLLIRPSKRINSPMTKLYCKLLLVLLLHFSPGYFLFFTLFTVLRIHDPQFNANDMSS
jgi:hypothetical protein